MKNIFSEIYPRDPNTVLADNNRTTMLSTPGGMLDLNLYGDVPTKKFLFTRLQKCCFEIGEKHTPKYKNWIN